jgi:hypothetical protein
MPPRPPPPDDEPTTPPARPPSARTLEMPADLAAALRTQPSVEVVDASPVSVPPADLPYPELVRRVWGLQRDMRAFDTRLTEVLTVLRATAGRQVETLQRAQGAEAAAAESEQRISQIESEIEAVVSHPPPRVAQLEGEVEGLRIELAQTRQQLDVAAKDTLAKAERDAALAATHDALAAADKVLQARTARAFKLFGWQTTVLIVATIAGQVLARWLFKGQ